MTVQRVHYLRARANKDRWDEEFLLLGYEMEWTVRSYKRESNSWRARTAMAQENGEHGHAAYGLRMSAMWEELIALAEERFKAVNVNYRTPRW